MATSKKDSRKKTHSGARRENKKATPRADLRGPWKPAWYIIWGFISVIGEVILIFTVKGKVFAPSNLQEVIIFLAIPFIAHLTVSAARTVLFLISD